MVITVKTYYDCIPCLVRQALDAARFSSVEETIHDHVLRDVLRMMSEMDFQKSPPLIGMHIHRIIRQVLGDDDPYKKPKDHFNRFVIEMYPDLKKRIENATNPLDMAVRMAIAGNIIDFGANSNVTRSLVYKTIDQSLSEKLFGNIDDIFNVIYSAESIVYLGDNAGEIVFDRLLIEQLPLDNVTFVVKGRPIINDVTITDAEDTGMTSLVEVIDNGSDAPGTILEECSEEFRRRFFGADLIIAKGQGNYETLNDIPKKILFMLKAKCSVIARDIGCKVGDLVIKRNI